MKSDPNTTQLLGKIENGTEIEAYEAAKVISNLQGPKILSGLTRILRIGERPYAREAAAYALSWHQNRKAVESLLACADDPGEQDSVRGQALEGMAVHLEHVSARSSLRQKAEKLMLRLLNSRSPTVRFWSCFGLGKLGSERAIPRLRKSAVTDTEICPGWWYVREEAEDALDWIVGKPGKDRVAVHLRNREDLKTRPSRKPRANG
jgi:hypothetical protein